MHRFSFNSARNRSSESRAKARAIIHWTYQTTLVQLCISPSILFVRTFFSKKNTTKCQKCQIYLIIFINFLLAKFWCCGVLSVSWFTVLMTCKETNVCKCMKCMKLCRCNKMLMLFSRSQKWTGVQLLQRSFFSFFSSCWES